MVAFDVLMVKLKRNLELNYKSYINNRSLTTHMMKCKIRAKTYFLSVLFFLLNDWGFGRKKLYGFSGRPLKDSL